MSEAKDQGIKLFGRTIPLPEKTPLSSCVSTVDDSIDHDRACSTNSSPEEDKSRDGEDRATEKLKLMQPASSKHEDGSMPVNSEESSNPDVSGNPKTPQAEETSMVKPSKIEEEHNSEPSSTTTSSQEKPLKKPDKILPCPRCNSMDTKFCYYNNYNVNQPRHFCKNCQRYWTAGGTMRNVPVGAGRRKNKNSASSQYRHITVSEALQNARADVVPNGVHHPALRTNGTVLTFGSDAPLAESMASVNIADKSMRNGARNGFHKSEEIRIQVTNNNHSNASLAMAVSSSKDEAVKTASQEHVLPNCQNFPPQIPCFPGGPWPYPWNSPQWSTPISPPGFCPPPAGFPVQFYPAAAAYWGAWNIPWVNQPSSPKTPTSGPNSPTLGKHSRDENIIKAQEGEPQKEANPEKSLWVPKTLRIDDPGEAAKSSIWTTLGIKNDKADSGLFKAFQPKGDEKKPIEETSPVLHANPAALSRSRNFHESS